MTGDTVWIFKGGLIMIAYAKRDEFLIVGGISKWTFRCYCHHVEYPNMPLIERSDDRKAFGLS